MKKTTDYLGADVVIDAVGAEADGNFLQHVTAAKLKLQGGSPVALNWAIDSVRKGGTVSVMGAYGPMFSAVKFGDAMNKGLTLRMNQCPVKRQWPRLFEHIRNGYLKPSDIVTHRIPLEHIAEGYHIFSAKLDGCIKPLIVPERRLRGGPRMAYTADKPAAARDHRASCAPGSPAGAPTSTRRTGPSVPRERFDPDATGAHWDFPERQPEKWPARAVDRARLPDPGVRHRPARRTGCPGASAGTPTRRYSEGRAAHWLLLIAADRVDAVGAPPALAGHACARTTRSPRPACSASSPTTGCRRGSARSAPTSSTSGWTRSSSRVRGCCAACSATGWPGAAPPHRIALNIGRPETHRFRTPSRTAASNDRFGRQESAV